MTLLLIRHRALSLHPPSLSVQKRKEEVDMRKHEARMKRQRELAERAIRVQEERERAVAQGLRTARLEEGEEEDGDDDESVASGGADVGMERHAWEDRRQEEREEREEEEEEMRAMKLLGKALAVEASHPTALVVRALLLMSTAVRVRTRRSINASRHAESEMTNCQGAGGGEALDAAAKQQQKVAGVTAGEQRSRSRSKSPGASKRAGEGGGGVHGTADDGTGRLVEEAEKLLCRVLSTDPSYGPALMAVAELLWQPVLLDRPIGAEAIYRYVMTATEHLGKGWRGGDGQGHGGGSALVLKDVLSRIDVQERRAVSYNLALLLTLRSADVGNAEACIEAEQLLQHSEQLLHQAFPRSSSQHAGADFLRGRLALSRRLYPLSETFFRRVLSINPRHADAKIWLATALADKAWTVEDTTASRHMNVALSRWKNKLLHRCFGAWTGSTSEMRILRQRKRLMGLPGANASVSTEGRVSRWNEAIMLAHEVLDADPWHAQSRLLLANIYLDHIHNPPRALRMIQPNIQDKLDRLGAADAIRVHAEGGVDGKRGGEGVGSAGLKHSRYTGIFEDGDRGMRIRRQSLLLGARILHESGDERVCFKLLKAALEDYPGEPSILMYLLRLMLRGRAGKQFVQVCRPEAKESSKEPCNSLQKSPVIDLHGT